MTKKPKGYNYEEETFPKGTVRYMDIEGCPVLISMTAKTDTAYVELIDVAFGWEPRPVTNQGDPQ